MIEVTESCSVLASAFTCIVWREGEVVSSAVSQLYCDGARWRRLGHLGVFPRQQRPVPR